MNRVPVIVFSILILLTAGTYFAQQEDSTSSAPTNWSLRYIAVGDSYTIGTGTTPHNAWPSVLERDLTAAGIPTTLVANPSRAGYTARDAVKRELPQLPEQADLTTLMIGVNDWVQGRSRQVFRRDLRILLDDLSNRTPRGRLFVVTIPDFSVAPRGSRYSGGRNITEGIKSFNQVIREEAEAYNTTVIDIFPLSRRMNTTHFSSDGLHPNAKGYKLWEEKIFDRINTSLQTENAETVNRT
jgi:lysophospholipase L1-like esterase